MSYSVCCFVDIPIALCAVAVFVHNVLICAVKYNISFFSRFVFVVLSRGLGCYRHRRSCPKFDQNIEKHVGRQSFLTC